MKIKCKERYKVCQEDTDNEIGTCSIINALLYDGGEHGIDWHTCEACQTGGAPDISNNTKLRSIAESLAKNETMGLHIKNAKIRQNKMPDTIERDYDHFLGKLESLGKDKTYLAGCITWLHAHSLIDEAKADELWQEFELDKEEFTQGEQDEILDFSRRLKI